MIAALNAYGLYKHDTANVVGRLQTFCRYEFLKKFEIDYKPEYLFDWLN